jgi:hypothetical protein
MSVSGKELAKMKLWLSEHKVFLPIAVEMDGRVRAGERFHDVLTDMIARRFAARIRAGTSTNDILAMRSKTEKPWHTEMASRIVFESVVRREFGMDVSAIGSDRFEYDRVWNHAVKNQFWIMRKNPAPALVVGLKAIIADGYRIPLALYIVLNDLTNRYPHLRIVARAYSGSPNVQMSLGKDDDWYGNDIPAIRKSFAGFSGIRFVNYPDRAYWDFMEIVKRS